jgi:hypothetical protein
MARDDGVNVRNTRDDLRDRLRIGHAAAAVAWIDARRVLAREQISRMRDAQCRKDDDHVAVRVPGTRVVQIQTILAAQ